MDIIGTIKAAGRSAVELSLFTLLPVMVVMLTVMRLAEAAGLLDRLTRLLAPLLRAFGLTGLSIIALLQVSFVSFAAPVATLATMGRQGVSDRHLATTFAMVLAMGQANVVFPMAALGLDVGRFLAISVLGGLVAAILTSHVFGRRLSRDGQGDDTLVSPAAVEDGGLFLHLRLAFARKYVQPRALGAAGARAWNVQACTWSRCRNAFDHAFASVRSQPPVPEPDALRTNGAEAQRALFERLSALRHGAGVPGWTRPDGSMIALAKPRAMQRADDPAMFATVRPFAALLLSTFLMMAGAGLVSALVPLRAAAEGWSAAAIAWIGTIYALAFTAGCVLVPVLVRRVGHIRTFAALQTSLACLLLLLALVPHPLAWMAFRGACGLGMVGGYMVIESWLNERANNANRGSVFSAYMVVSMVGIAAGQFLLPLGDIAAPTLFMASALAFGLALLPVMLSTAPAPRPLEVVRIDAKALFRKSPAAVVGCFVTGIIFGNWSYFGPLYGQAAGLDTTGIAIMLTAAMVGGVLFQFPFGRLSDRIDRRYVMGLAGAVGVAVSTTMLLAAPRDPAGVIAGMFAFGTVLFTIYSLSVAHANDQAEPGEFVGVSGGLLIVYGLGSMVGPQLGGRLMDRFGPDGFFIAMGSMYAIYGGYALWRSTRKPAFPPNLRPDFCPVAPMSMQSPVPVEPEARAMSDADLPEAAPGR